MFGKKAVVIKVYKHKHDFERDAQKMIRDYDIEQVTTKSGDVNLGRTGLQFVLGSALTPVVGLLWAMGKPSRQDDLITVIWVKKEKVKT